MDPNPYESPVATASAVQATGIPWRNVCISGILIAVSGAMMSALLDAITFVPDAYPFRDRSKSIAVIIIVAGLLASIVGGIGWWRRK